MDGYDIFYLKNTDESLKFRHHNHFVIIFNVLMEFQAILNNRRVCIDKGCMVLLDESDNLHLISSYRSDSARYELYLSKQYVYELSTALTDLAECFRYKDFSEVNIMRLSEAEAELVRTNMAKLMELADSGDIYGTDLTKRLLVSSILLVANRNFRRIFSLSSSDLPLPMNSRFHQIVTFVRENYWEDITMDGLSIKFSISRNDLCSLFRQFTCKTPIQYLIEYRISKATEFLKEAVSVESVCTKVGFNNYPHFSRTFKKYVGVSPKQYQNNMRRQH